MINRLYTVAALTAAIALSASIAISRAGPEQGAPVRGHTASAIANPPAAASAGSTGPLRQGTGAAVNFAESNTRLGNAAAASAAASSSAPTLVTVKGGAHLLARGAQKAVPVAVSEDQAFNAIFKGGMWLPNTTGGREYAKYDHHLIHDNGDWTWVGKVQTDHGLQSAVITFGKDAVFGLIPQASGHPLRLVTAGGQKMLVRTDGNKMAQAAEALQLHARQDFQVPKRHGSASARPRTSSAQVSTRTQAGAQVQASASTASGGPVIDVMVAYTPGLVSDYGSTAAAMTRVNNLVDVTNQAYVDSGVNQSIRLVHTMQVNYTDTNDETKALDDLTGSDGQGNTLPIPSSLQGVASARTQYGADLVVLLRHFNNAGNNGCGVAWLIGGGAQQITPSQDNAFGYSVVQDGSDGGYYCLDSTFAHELGHNMGSAHDRANADQPGAYSYSYGYRGNGVNGFATIMAYGSDTQTPLDLFSNPNISKCQNSPCGVADSSSTSADNAHSLNNTAALIAQFEPTKVATASRAARNDVNGDGKSDVLLERNDGTAFGYWILNGEQLSRAWSVSTSPAYRVVATGDFNGDGYEDIVWEDASNGVRLWFGDGTNFSMGHPVATLPAGWRIIGAADVDGDGKSDLLLEFGNNEKFGYWVMDGQQVKRTWSTSTNPAYTVAAVGDFNGDGHLDIAWTSAARDVRLWFGDGTNFNMGHPVGYYTAGWRVVGAGDVDGDGKTDLLLQYGNNNGFGYWILNGQQLVRTWSAATNSAYRFVEAGDFDGNGTLDIAWTSDQNDIRLWFGNGTTFSMGHPVGNYGGDLMPVGEFP